MVAGAYHVVTLCVQLLHDLLAIAKFLVCIYWPLMLVLVQSIGVICEQAVDLF